MIAGNALHVSDTLIDGVVGAWRSKSTVTSGTPQVIIENTRSGIVPDRH